mmetsp:Transcript_6571/g.12213  ORF Transcript_6571/g.12213 Transcript_6571/m.12213 type:complete len:799 (-) Transcript_6571:104-2500(-)|eukprot:CAMPEP_0172668584 /NCGR_PEP_ID=MMETSP1074-20121228/9149_1 /TAXON_ID=2916 /ORGANISM="Ceratium fusus, Strain PA161109" /LENGTH=798 /DNA_ID=CAMNT_0013485247 /DNA_START=129 /DNA_END=2525 /DNA_ORIENTATION=-
MTHRRQASPGGAERHLRMEPVASNTSSRKEEINSGRRRPHNFVSVAVRIRPVFGHAGEQRVVYAKPPVNGIVQPRLCCNRGYILEEYEFSKVFSPQDDNFTLFNDLQGTVLTSSVFSGVNETLFAYGQTGSGKTHTIFGTREEPGLLQLFVRSVFDRAEVSMGSTVHICCYEILGDSLTDLLSPEPLLDCGELREEDIVYDELFIKTQRCRYQIIRVSSINACLSLLHDARLNRTAGVSSCNSSSSRSHAVVHLFVQNPASDCSGSSSSIGALTLVDLAGTEKEHENPSEQGRKSARLLNTSLSSLNRLLRKLQTGTLDESERRQSVLNKCLWEYLRPGCGISLIFCVNPLLRHRAISLSTLAMASDSKLIQTHRKAQYVQLPPSSNQEQQMLVPRMPRSPRRQAASSVQSASAPSTPQDLQGSEQLSRGTTPRCTPTSRIPVNERTPDFCMTPKMGGIRNSVGGASSSAPSGYSAPALESTNPFALSHEMLHEPLAPEELERLYGYDLRSPAAVRNLALQNTKLRRKLSRARAKSQERVLRAERERDVISARNAALQRECESLRNLFIRQQQQQLAFWTGPFIDMVAPGSSCSASLAASAMPPSTASLGKAWEARAEAATAASAGKPSIGSSKEPTGLGEPPDEGSASECAFSIQRERDYWRSVATDLKRELQVSPPPPSSVKCSQQSSDLSTSQSQPEMGEPPQWSGSDTGSEISMRITGIHDSPSQLPVGGTSAAALPSELSMRITEMHDSPSQPQAVGSGVAAVMPTPSSGQPLAAEVWLLPDALAATRGSEEA